MIEAGAAKSMPGWAGELVAVYEGNARNQFILHGNIHDRVLLGKGTADRSLGTVEDFLQQTLLGDFQVILRYDLGNGLAILKGGQHIEDWPAYKAAGGKLPREPLPAIETLTRYFRYVANLGRLGKEALHVACILRHADLVAPASQGGMQFELNAIASLIREWATESLLTQSPLATFLLVENLNDLHSLLVNNPRVERIRIPLPGVEEIERTLDYIATQAPQAAAGIADRKAAAAQLAGATLSSIEGLFRLAERRKEGVSPRHLADMKKSLVEKDCNGLIEFIDSHRTLNDLYGVEKIKAWLRQDVALWQKNDVQALPMGYLICGPVGTGKTFMVECFAGEAGVPVVKFKNFRDKWVGSSEGNLERIFRLIHALGRCVVFIDEADQALGRRQASADDSGLSGRIYSMMAEEMGNTKNRGKILWILASSRPDLIEVDLKRPGRVDVKIPIFPTTTADESFHLLQALCKRRGIEVPETAFADLKERLPLLMTPGAAEALAVKVYRLSRSGGKSPLDVLKDCLADYRHPVPLEALQFQIGLAVREATDIEFIPELFRSPPTTHGS